MNPAEAVDMVSARLVSVGFEKVAARFKVAAVTFDSPAVLSGKPERGSDLVVVIDTENAGDRGTRARQRLEALTMALDVAQWRVVVTAILVGPPLPSETVEELTRTCRVLSVTQATLDGVAGAPSLDDRLRVLLPLHVGFGEDALAADPIGQIARQMAETADARLADQLIAASIRGEDEVRRVLARTLEAAVAPGLVLA